MSHSLARIWVHSVFGTKYRQNLILPEYEKEVHALIVEEFEKMDCRVREINGTEDHVHCIFLLDKKHSLSKVMNQVKGVVSKKLNDLKILPDFFKWQVGYGAFSVSHDRVPIVQRYVQRQKEHHKKETFPEELKRFEELHEMVWIDFEEEVSRV